ncbi:type II toxin-antitoxin system MqsA family antitoxin [Burkholderia pseudomultivorans]|uniref:helix-turn-helix domain-containing protein n=1 Tax=Burkholderia pseudomultivorans TaxID=1207504 RepID=UPI0028763150|nr:helix-turn-helix domain-containing protein [Burkholderia pseudomultivorans]MDS0860570.1 type II toxin-antitoxin system MqsA family antitoxin [Burkholderia pseudomultivorans]
MSVTEQNTEPDEEMDRFHAALLRSVREMKTGIEGRVTLAQPTDASVARAKVGMSQSEFANLLGVSVRTYRQWEQGRRKPTGAALTLLRVAIKHPEALKGLSTVS